MSDLPAVLATLIDQVLRHADLDEDSARTSRADLEQHFRDGLARGRSVEDLIERFGDPAVAGPLISRTPPPRSAVKGGGAGDGPVASLLHDVRHALRGLARTPSLTVTATVVLALGIGANTVVFTVVNELLLRPIAVEDPSTLVDIWSEIPGGNSFLGIAYQDYVTYSAETAVFDDLAAFTGRQLELDRGGEPERVVGQFVTPGYLEMLGITADVGSLSFDPDARFGESPVVVLSNGFWVESFGGDPDVVGRTIRLQGQPVTVLGVAPSGFTGHFIGFPSDMWLPITAAVPLLAGFDPADRTQKDLEMIGRLREGVTAETAREVLNSRAEEIERSYPEINRGHRLGVSPTTGVDHSLRSGVTAFVFILGAVSMLVLLIACLNVGSMLLVRTMARDREIAVRIALGAGRSRLLRQLLTESATLVTLGAVAGTLVALRLNAAIADLLRSLAAGVALDLMVDWRVLGLTGLVALIASVLASAAPALHVFGKHPAGVLRARGGPSRSATRLRSGLVAGQVAVSVVLVIATGLFVRGLVAGAGVDPGFDADAVATFTLQMPDGMDAGTRLTVEREITDALHALPGIAAVAIGSTPPVGVARSPLSIDVPGVLPPPGEDRNVVDVRTVGADYLSVVGVPLRAGRDFSEADDRTGALVAVVSQAFVDRFWPGEDPVGRGFTAGDREARVVGVAADARYIVQDAQPDPLVYLSRGGADARAVLVTLRSEEPLSLGEAVQETISARIPGHRRVRLRTGREALDTALLPQRLGAVIVGAMGLTALFLAAVGLYGLIQFTVTRDTHELGVRLALGGGRRDLFLVVLRKGVSLVAIGTGVGVGVALLLAPGLGTFLSGVSPADPVTYFGVVGCFAVVALIASWLPARRALRIEATEALRGDV